MERDIKHNGENSSYDYIHMSEEDFEPVCNTETKSNNSNNNGGSTDYYKFKAKWEECADVIEDREMNYNQGNIFKSAFCFNVGRHDGTDYERDLNKIIYFAQRELNRLRL